MSPKRRRSKGSRWTPRNLDTRRMAPAARDAAHAEIGKRIGAHLDLHGSWEGNLHGKRVRITVDPDGRIEHRILGKAR